MSEEDAKKLIPGDLFLNNHLDLSKDGGGCYRVLDNKPTAKVPHLIREFGYMNSNRFMTNGHKCLLVYLEMDQYKRIGNSPL